MFVPRQIEICGPKKIPNAHKSLLDYTPEKFSPYLFVCLGLYLWYETDENKYKIFLHIWQMCTQTCRAIPKGDEKSLILLYYPT